MRAFGRVAAMAYATPPPASALNGDARPNLKLSTSIRNRPKLHQVITSVPPAPNPSSAPSSTSLAAQQNGLHPARNPSNASSPAVTPLQTATDGLRATSSTTLGVPAPLELGESVMAVPDSPNHSNSGDFVIPNPNKGPGLMRRISRGAASKLSRRRPSASQNDKRDRSSGPVIVRRRSDSKPATLNGRESALESSNEDDSNGALDSLGSWRGSEASSLPSENHMRAAHDAGVVAPKADLAVQRGTILTKVTNKRRKHVRFFLDLDAAKVYWDASNPAKRFYIDDIKEIRVGPDARNYRVEHQVPQEAESKWFTIIIADAEKAKGRSVKMLHLIAPSEHVREQWTTTLEHISRYRIGLMAGLASSAQSEAVLKAYWQREMSMLFPQGPKPGETESLHFGAVESMCRGLHINCSRNMLLAQFSKADSAGKGKLDFAEFKIFLLRLKERKDVKAIYKGQAADAKEGLTIDEFLSFLRDVQQENVDADPAYWASIFDKFVRRSKSRAQNQPEGVDGQVPRMSLEAFSSFLSSACNGVYASNAPLLRFDRPLNEYFISSSHNTYLLGRQVAGASSTEAYVGALQQGCRCVEIDCWDGGDGRPVVSHGRTMTSSVLFADCINVINKYAFVSTDFPLVLSLEVHCNPDQQLVMVEIMKDTFKDQLVLEPLLANSFFLPSPEELKGRILVKVKTCDEVEGEMQRHTAGSYIARGRKRSSSSPFMRPSVPDSPAVQNLQPLSSFHTIGPVDNIGPALTQDRRSMTTTSVSSATEDSDGASMSIKREKRKRQKSKITKPLSDLGVYARGYKWHSFSSPESQRFNHIYSFAERSFENICRDPENESLLEKHNRKFLTRVYPSGFRLRSSNFDPLKFWRRGVQMAALNWQTYDLGMQLNQAMFAAGTDRTGYVLKPESLRISSMFDEEKKMERKLVRFEVDVISAQQLPRPRSIGPDDDLNPYVEIEMFSADDRGQSLVVGEGGMNASGRNGMSGIGFPHRRRTKIEQSNGYSPIFNDRFKLSLETNHPDLVFVRWTVSSSLDGRNVGNNSVQLATFTAKLSSLSQGYRYIPLHDGSGDQYLFSTLFCRITKQEPVLVQPLNLEELKVEPRGILRQIGQTVFKRGTSSERPRDVQERGSSTPVSPDDRDISPSLTPSLSGTSTSSLPP